MIDHLDLVVDGRRLHVLASGAPLEPRRAVMPPVLVLLHAFPLHARMWEPQLAEPPGGWSVLAPDFGGFGRSQAGPLTPTGPSLDDYAAEVLALLDHLGLARAVFAGLSMGGYVALAIQRRAPGRLSGLVLADTRADADSVEARAGRESMLAMLDREGVAAVATQLLPRLVGTTASAAHPGVVASVRAMIAAADPDGVASAIRRLRDRPDSSAILATIRCPTLVVAGTEDALTPPDQVRSLADRIPGATFVAIEGAGHLSNLERPRAFNRVLAGFLGALPGQP